jgi:hypothetical protein
MILRGVVYVIHAEYIYFGKGFNQPIEANSFPECIEVYFPLKYNATIDPTAFPKIRENKTGSSIKFWEDTLSGGNSIYKNKYLKYKQKYLSLKSKLNI